MIFLLAVLGHHTGEFNDIRYLSVNKAGHLMVCDTGNYRVQLFELSGKFVTTFGTQGREEGKFIRPGAIAVLSDGRVVATDTFNCRIQIFE